MDVVSPHTVRGGGAACGSGDGRGGPEEKNTSSKGCRDVDDGMEEALLEALMDEEHSSRRGGGDATISNTGIEEQKGRRRRSLKRPLVVQKKQATGEKTKAQKHTSSTAEEEAGYHGAPGCSEQCLTNLPVDCLERIVARLSPNALCHLAQTCRLCRSLASSASLWKALYYTRWPYGLQEGEEVIKKEDWKQLYMERDAEEIKNVMGVVQEDAQLYSQMTLACREQSLTDESADATLCMATNTMCVPGSLKDQVLKFKMYHGIEEFRSLDETGGCCSCEYVRLTGHHWICRHCGTMHACGDMCEERDRCVGDEMLVCRVTGCCFRDMIDEHEEPQQRENAEEGHDVGRLGRAFLAGYHASDRREMFMKFGVSMD